MKRKQTITEEIIGDKVKAGKTEDSQKAIVLQRAIDDITKRFGEGSIVLLGNNTKLEVDVISTGSLTVDIATGVGGIPRGRITEVFGPEASGKTSLCLHIIAEAQKLSGMCAFIDMEHALDPRYAKSLGVNFDKLYFAQPDSGEQGLEMTEALVRSGALDVIVVDSVAALVPQAELDGDFGSSHVGLQARLMSQAMRKLNGVIKQSHTIVIFTNQLREKVGVMFGSPEVTPGGRALKFYASMRLDVRRIQSIKKGEDVVGSRVKVKVVKNKVAAPFREAEYDLMMHSGISKVGEIVDLGVAADIIDKRGAFLRYNDALLGQGRENAKEQLRNNPELAGEIEKLIRDKFEKDNDLFYSAPTIIEKVESELHKDGTEDKDYVSPYADETIGSE